MSLTTKYIIKSGNHCDSSVLHKVGNIYKFEGMYFVLACFYSSDAKPMCYLTHITTGTSFNTPFEINNVQDVQIKELERGIERTFSDWELVQKAEFTFDI